MGEKRITLLAKKTMYRPNRKGGKRRERPREKEEYPEKKRRESSTS